MNFTKPFLALALTSFLFISCKETGAEPKTETSTETAAPVKEVTAIAKPETATFHIEGMTCAMGCAKTIEKELAGMDGVQSATVDFDKKTATVQFDASKQTPEKLVETVEATADGKTYKVSDLKFSENQAKVATETKPACCAGKKHCSADEKKASAM